MVPKKLPTNYQNCYFNPNKVQQASRSFRRSHPPVLWWPFCIFNTCLQSASVPSGNKILEVWDSQVLSHLFVYLFVCLFVCLFIYLFFSSVELLQMTSILVKSFTSPLIAACNQQNLKDLNVYTKNIKHLLLSEQYSKEPIS